MHRNESQTSLFTDGCDELSLPDAEIRYYANFLCADVAWDTYQALLKETHWEQKEITVYGKTHPTPRLSCWVGDPGADYRYSNMTMQPKPWSLMLLEIKKQVEIASAHTFNSVLLNYYRDGNDSNGWHSDNEPELGDDPVIASLSLGAPRDFKLRHKRDQALRHCLSLVPGSLLIMQGSTQRCWQHQVPKRASAAGRINLTFRKIIK